MMNSLQYFGHAKLDCMAFWYVCERFKNGDGYAVFDVDGLPLFGFLPNEARPIHKLQINPSARN